MNSEDNFKIYKREKLPSSAVRQYENNLESNPDDAVSRIKLLGHYLAMLDTSKFVEHYCWMIYVLPEDFVTSFVSATIHLPNRAIEVVKRKWFDHLHGQNSSARTVVTATEFFLFQKDIRSALTCLERLQEHVPKDKDFSCIASTYEHLHMLVSRTNEFEVSKKDVLNSALYWCRKAVEVEREETSKNFAQFQLLKLLVKAELATEAKIVAENLLKKAADDPTMYVYSKHLANTFLGKIALWEGDTNSAINYLQLSAESSDDLLFWSKGPELILAEGLLEIGESKAVLEFLDSVLNLDLHEHPRNNLVRWRETISLH